MNIWYILEFGTIYILLFRNNNNGDIELLKNELNLRVEEVDRQRKEMAAMADRWTDEVKSIHATHQQEKKELAEVSLSFSFLF